MFLGVEASPNLAGAELALSRQAVPSWIVEGCNLGTS